MPITDTNSHSKALLGVSGFVKKWLVYRIPASALWCAYVFRAMLAIWCGNSGVLILKDADIWFPYAPYAFAAVLIALAICTRKIDVFFYLVYVWLFPVVVVFLLLSAAIRVLRISKSLARSGLFFLIIVLMVVPLLGQIESRTNGVQEMHWVITLHLVAIGLVLLFALQWSAHPFLWGIPLLGAAKRLWGTVGLSEDSRKKLPADEAARRAKIEEKLKEAGEWEKALSWMERIAKSDQRKAKRWVVYSFFCMLLFAIVWTVWQFAGIYESLYRVNPDGWIVVQAMQPLRGEHWLLYSFSVFTTSGYLDVKPVGMLTCYVVSAQAVTSLAIITIFFVAFSVNAEMALQELGEQIVGFVSQAREDIKTWNGLLERPDERLLGGSPQSEGH